MCVLASRDAYLEKVLDKESVDGMWMRMRVDVIITGDHRRSDIHRTGALSVFVHRAAPRFIPER